MMILPPGLDSARLLDAALARRLPGLAVEVGVSVPRLAQMCLQLVDDPAVMAAHPVAARQLRQRRDDARAARLARW